MQAACHSDSLANSFDCLRGLTTDAAILAEAEVNAKLDLNPNQVPSGLVPAVNELFAGLGIRPVGTALPPLPTSETAPLARCEVLSQIARGAESLIVRKNGQSLLPFIARLCATFTQSRIIVTVSNKRTGIETVNFLRSQGEDCWFLDDEYWLKEDQVRPKHRIRIVLQDKLWLNSLELANADIVVITDSAFFVRDNEECPHTLLFDQQFGLHFKEDVRLVGIAQEDLALADFKRIWPIFGLRTYQLNTHGEAYLAPRVTWITRSKQDRSLFASGLTQDSTHRQKLKALVWENQPRNNAILRLARRLKHEALEYSFVRERYGNSLCNPVAIVTENLLHRRVLVGMQEGHKVRVPVMAFEDIEQRDDLPSFLVRADAGTGLLPLLAQRNGIWVVDMQDQTSKYLSKRARSRQKAYLRHWHVGEQPFVSKWQSIHRL